MQRLTLSQLNYMLCIRTLTAEGTVRATDISRRIGLSMPSVHNMLGTLEGMALVEKHRHSVALTPMGEEVLAYYDGAISAAEKLLRSLGAEDTHSDAMILVTALSDSTVNRIIEAMN